MRVNERKKSEREKRARRRGKGKIRERRVRREISPLRQPEKSHNFSTPNVTESTAHFHSLRPPFLNSESFPKFPRILSAHCFCTMYYENP